MRRQGFFQVFHNKSHSEGIPSFQKGLRDIPANVGDIAGGFAGNRHIRGGTAESRYTITCFDANKDVFYLRDGFISDGVGLL